MSQINAGLCVCCMARRAAPLEGMDEPNSYNNIIIPKNMRKTSERDDVSKFNESV